jgi:hypothetical protein
LSLREVVSVCWSPFVSHLFLTLLALAGVGSLARWYFSHHSVIRRQVAAMARTPINEVTTGRVRVVGTLRPVGIGMELMAPGTGRPCLAFDVLVFTDDGESGRRKMVRLHGGAPFAIEDETGCARVEAHDHVHVAIDPDDLRVGSADGTTVMHMIRERGISETTWYGGSRDFRYEEAIIAAGQVASVVGFATVEIDSDSARPGPRQIPIHAVLRDHGQGEPLLILDGRGADRGS